MASYWIYIQVILEIVASFLIFPLFNFSKENNSKKNIFILLSVITILFFLLIILFSFTNPLLKSMIKMNENESISENTLKKFLWISMISNTLIIYEEYLMADIIIEKKSNKVYIFTAISLVLKILLDILFLAKFSPIKYSINNIAFSQLCSSIIIIFLCN